MPWIDADFSANADSSGAIRHEQLLISPGSGRLKRYRVKTTTGCTGRTHLANLSIIRSDDTSDKVEISAIIKDCEEFDNQVDPEYRVQNGKKYAIKFSVDSFSARETVTGSGGVFYTLFFEMKNESNS